MLAGPSRTTVRMLACSLPLSHNELRPVWLADRGPVLVQAPRADGVDLAVGVFEVGVFDRGMRPHHVLDFGLRPLMPVVGRLGRRFQRMQLCFCKMLETLVDVAHLEFG